MPCLHMTSFKGREVWFRAPRYEARKLFPHGPPRVQVGSSLHRLQDISLGGLAILCSQTATDVPEVGDVVPLAIRQSGHAIFESKALVCRRENTLHGSKLAFSLVNNFIEFDKLLSRNTLARITAQSAVAPSAERLVPEDYRLLCADALKLLGSYRDLLDEHAVLARHFGRAFDVDGTYSACEADLIQRWRSLWRTGNDLARDMLGDQDLLDATKRFTETVLTPEMSLGAIWNRSYAKPLGYPGDFEVMNQVYDGTRRGATVYEMLLQRIGLEVADCIRTRMEVVRDRIADIVREKGNGRAARIMSLGSGPAREVELFLASGNLKSSCAEFTLIDQEQAALKHALEKTYPLLATHNSRARVQCLNISFTDILRGGGALAHVPPQDLIYSVGLIDYLADRRARALVRKLYDALAPGGLLIIGNMNETPLSNLWPMEFIVDWTLYYRSDTQMLAWTAGMGAAQAWTETECTGRVRLLFARKPGA
jgi:extracellular factor (EF) 3-hydroxypalmitic acid methyl ester biosynthesis protein